MKYSITTIILLLSLTFELAAQNITVTREKSKEINSFAQDIRNIESFLTSNPTPISIRLFECGKSVGSLPEGLDVIFYDFYISVKQATEKNPNGEFGWFWVNGKFINPRNYEFEPQTKTLTFDHGTDDSPTSTKLRISFKSIKVE